MGGTVSATVGYGVCGVPKVVLACQWARPWSSWSQGGVWPLLWGHSFLASHACPLVGEAGLESCVRCWCFPTGGAGS